MGNFSSQLLQEEIIELSHSSTFSHAQIIKLYKRFKTLDKENKSCISLLEFMAIPELAMNPLANRILTVFDKSSKSELTFKDFISCLSVFLASTKREIKLKFAFDVYDVDDDGFIGNLDLRTIIKLMVTFVFSK